MAPIIPGASVIDPSAGAVTVAGSLAPESPVCTVCFHDVATGKAFDSFGSYDTVDRLGVMMTFGSASHCHDVFSPPVNANNPKWCVSVVTEVEIILAERPASNVEVTVETDTIVVDTSSESPDES